MPHTLLDGCKTRTRSPLRPNRHGGGAPRAGLAALIVALAVVSLPVASAAADLLSHRALYRLSVERPAPNATITSVRGVFGISWRESCEGWLSEQHMLFSGSDERGKAMSVDRRYSSVETLQPHTLDFTVRSFDDGALQEEFEGTAGRHVLSAPGLGTATARFTQPVGVELELPEGTVFPTRHIIELIAAARAGTRFVTHAVFDGSGPDGLSHVSAVIGRALDVPENGTPGGMAEGDTVSGEDLDGRRWPVTLSYFPIEESIDSSPELQVLFDLHEQGVFSNVVLDYGDFAMRAELEEFAVIPTPEC